VARAQARLAALHDERDEARRRWAELAEAPKAYADALTAKERRLIGSDDPRRRGLLDLVDRRERLAAELREVGEARSAADTAARALVVVLDRLSRASLWSAFSTFVPGGVLGGSVQYRRLDEAAPAARRVDRCVAALRTELADLGGAGVIAPQLAIERPRLDPFTFFLASVAVHERIERALRNAGRLAQLVHDVQVRLHEGKGQIIEELAAVEAERRDLLTRR
jgi:hypothetical protein